MTFPSERPATLAEAATGYLAPLTPMRPASTPSSTVSFIANTEAQLRAWKSLEARLVLYRETSLRRHNWEWIPNSETWLPYYVHQEPTKITDYWSEWTEGLNGFLPVRVLDEVWGAKWRRNNKGMQTERCRRKKVIELIENLARKPNWTTELVLRFLRDRYESPIPRPFPTPRSFAEYLQKKGGVGMTEVINVSDSYP